MSIEKLKELVSQCDVGSGKPARENTDGWVTNMPEGGHRGLSPAWYTWARLVREGKTLQVCMGESLGDTPISISVALAGRDLKEVFSLAVEAAATLSTDMS